MDNMVFQRIFIAFLTIPATFAVIYAVGYLKFPSNVILAAVGVSIIGGLLFYMTRKERAARFETYYSAATDFGRPISFDGYSAAFERDGTQFDCGFPSSKNDTALKVNFYVSNVRQRFIIQHDSINRKTMPECGYVKSTFLSDDFYLQCEGSAQSEDFLMNLLKNRNIAGELYNYPKSMMTAFSIVFDDGSFEIHWTAPAGEQSDGFYKLCRTATVFHDELKKLAKPN
jgi:hypothetical protein